MIRLICSKDNEIQIINHEEHMLSIYKKKIQEYAGSFEERGYALKVSLMWKVYPKDKILFQRADFQNGYQCYVYCVVEKNGKEVCVKSVDGEVAYYALSTTWNISSIFRRFLKLRVWLYSDVDDVDVELKNLQSRLCCIK